MQRLLCECEAGSEPHYRYEVKEDSKIEEAKVPKAERVEETAMSRLSA